MQFLAINIDKNVVLCYSSAMNYHLETDIRSTVEDLFLHFNKLFHVSIAYITPDGDKTIDTSNVPSNDYCHLIRKKLQLEKICLDLEKRKREEAEKNRQTVQYTCHGGLINVVEPLFQDGIMKGFLQVGQFRQITEVPAALSHKWHLENESADLSKQFINLPYFRQREVEHITQLFFLMSKLIIQNNLIEIKNSTPLQPIISHMKTNHNYQLSLSEAAELIGKSESRLSHLFQEKFGKSFKQVQSEIIVDATEKQLENNPQLSVKELALNMGFKDPLYFSKFYKKNKGITLKEYKTRSL